jgi:hypothetical protein
MSGVKNRYDEVFQIEMEGWAYGLANYPGEIFPELVFRVIRELESSFVAALQHGHAFNILELSEIFSKAAKYLVHEKDISFCILSILPLPSSLDLDAQFTMAQVIDQVEQTYGGALERMEKKWKWEQKSEASNTQKKSDSPPGSYTLKAV